MPNLPNNNSFIPKQGPEKRLRKTASRQVHLFTIASYLLFFSTLAASVVVIFYERHIDSKLEEAVVALNGEIADFNTERLEEVKEFDSKIKQAQNRIDSGASVVSIFNALEASTAQTAKITELVLKRDFDEAYTLAATIETDSFDSSIFQRSSFGSNGIVEDLKVEDLEIINEVSGEGINASGEKIVRFTAEIVVPVDDIPLNEVSAAPLPISAPPVSSPDIVEEIIEEELIDNQDTI